MGYDYTPLKEDSLTAQVRELHAPSALSPGHAQIGMQCVACHGDGPMAGVDAMQEKCIGCHSRNDDNKLENTHPRAKFEDPANADRLNRINALQCISCHSEHKPAATSQLGVSLPRDFCIACHDDIAKETPSHKGMDFNTCSMAGCHSYHDNRNTYRKLLRRNIDKDAPKKRQVKKRSFVANPKKYGIDKNPHGKAQAIGQCKNCHSAESELFGKGKHGMREAAGLRPMSPALSEKSFKADAVDQSLSCTSCHEANKPDTRKAAVAACLECHDDEHSNAYESSRHAELWRQESRGDARAGTGVSCATCHLPRQKRKTPDGYKRIVVNHDQTANLRPVIKQTRVCTQCHSLQFTYNALADEDLLKNNFNGLPTVLVESINMEEERVARKRQEREQQRKQQLQEEEVASPH